jgi:hypothetical protein
MATSHLVTRMVTESTRQPDSGAVNDRRDPRSGLLVHRRHNVGVGVERHLDAGVSEPFLDHLGMHSGLQCERGVSMAEVVQSDFRYSGETDEVSKLV